MDDGIHVGKKNGDGRLWEKCMWAEQMALQHRQIERLLGVTTYVLSVYAVRTENTNIFFFCFFFLQRDFCGGLFLSLFY